MRIRLCFLGPSWHLQSVRATEIVSIGDFAELTDREGSLLGIEYRHHRIHSQYLRFRFQISCLIGRFWGVRLPQEGYV